MTHLYYFFLHLIDINHGLEIYPNCFTKIMLILLFNFLKMGQVEKKILHLFTIAKPREKVEDLFFPTYFLPNYKCVLYGRKCGIKFGGGTGAIVLLLFEVK